MNESNVLRIMLRNNAPSILMSLVSELFDEITLLVPPTLKILEQKCSHVF